MQAVGIMNNYEHWAQLVAKRLKGEADIIASIEKDELEDTAANDAFVRAVLEPFLPENFGVGSGRIVDAFGNQSDHMDIVVYNRDFPRIGMIGANSAFLYESVLAVFSVRAKFIRKTFFDSLNACASLAKLETNIDKNELVKLAKRNGLKPAPNKKFVHEDPMRTARFELIGRPPAFVFGFSGIKHSYRQLQENIELWMDNRYQNAIETPMKALPAVIATQGCFAWRNAAPLALSNRELLGIGNDDAPIRLIVLQLLYLLNRRLNVTADGYGLKPSLKAYLSQFSAPKFEIGVGNVDLSNLEKPVEAATESETLSSRYEAARDQTTVLMPAVKSPPEPPADAIAPAADPQPAAEVAAAEPPPEPLPDTIVPADEPETEAEAVVFDKPSPFASAPVLQVEDPAPATEAPPQSSPAPAAPLGSAPIPSMKPAESTAEAPPAPTAPLESAPPPSMKPAESTAEAPPAPAAPLESAPPPPSMKPAESPAEAPPAPAAPLESAPPANDVAPPKPPVDINLGSADDGAKEDKVEAEEDEFLDTVIIPPNALPSSQDNGQNSTDAFIARVKEQLTTSESIAANGEDSFSSTIPQ